MTASLVAGVMMLESVIDDGASFANRSSLAALEFICVVYIVSFSNQVRKTAC